MEVGCLCRPRRKETVLEKVQHSILSWFGHVVRVCNDWLPFLALHAVLPGRRSRGRGGQRTFKRIWSKQDAACHKSQESRRTGLCWKHSSSSVGSLEERWTGVKKKKKKVAYVWLSSRIADVVFCVIDTLHSLRSRVYVWNSRASVCPSVYPTVW